MSKKLSSTLGGIMFILACTGAAFAMPTAFMDEDTSVLEDLEQTAPEDLEATPVVTETPEPTPTPTPTPTDDADDAEADETDGDATENHGKAVSTAAHCAVKGRAHGELVRSVAQDKDATVASAQAACDAALAAAAAAPAVKPARVPKAPKPDKATGSSKPVKAPKAPKTDVPVVTETEDTTVESGSTQGGPPPGKGNPHKP